MRPFGVGATRLFRRKIIPTKRLQALYSLLGSLWVMATGPSSDNMGLVHSKWTVSPTI